MGRTVQMTSSAAITAAEELGARLKMRRKNLGLSAVEVSEAAGISRVTLHRIENGETGVTMGAYMATAKALGESIGLLGSRSEKDLLQDIAIKHFPQLKRLSWQLADATILTPIEAWSIYTRNWRHLHEDELGEAERELIDSLRGEFEFGHHV